MLGARAAAIGAARLHDDSPSDKTRTKQSGLRISKPAMGKSVEWRVSLGPAVFPEALVTDSPAYVLSHRGQINLGARGAANGHPDDIPLRYGPYFCQWLGG